VTETNPSDIRPQTPAASSGFWALIATQFQGAFSDNALKWLAISIVAGMNLPSEQNDRLVGIVGALFALPFIVFSMTGGFLADRFSKRSVMIGVKCFEILVMLIALTGLAAGRIYVTIACVFLMGVHSAIFGPSKYGSLPELLPPKRLSWGNGVLELGTFIAIIGGTVAGGTMCKLFATQPAWSGAVLIALACAGLGFSLGITKIPAANPAKQYRINFVTDLWRQLRLIHQDRPLWLAVIGNTYFFGIAALIQFVIVIYAKQSLHLDDPMQSSYLQAATAIGIGLGSFAAGYLSGGKIETGLIPLGAAGLTVCSALLGRSGLSFGSVAVHLAALGFFGGFFIVPISALLQHRPASGQKGGVLAAANLVSFIAIFLASGVFYWLASTVGLTPPQIFLAIAAATLGATVYLLWLLPDSLLRFLLWCVTHSLYRIRVAGRDHIPEKGGALFVCNHVSYLDALLLLASTDREVRFMMFKDIYEQPWIKPFAKMLRVIPVSSDQRPREMLQSLQAASEAIRNGEVVCIFAEGQITRIGQLLPFRRGMERIMKNVAAPIIPVALDGVLGGPWSFRRGRLIHLVTSRCLYPVTVSFGRPMPPDTQPFAVREAVQALQVNAWQLRRGRMAPLHRCFIRMARQHPHRFAFADAQTPRVNFGSALTRTVFLARRLKPVWAGQHMVGLYLPPSVPGALVNYAAFLSGKVPVNLNYTLSETTLAACVAQCKIETIITSRQFIEKIKLTPPGRLIYLEDLAAAPSLGEKVSAFLITWFLPAAWLERKLGSRHVGMEDLATIIFSSGSTGEPKGVMLSQFNLLANIHQCGEVIALNETQRILGILPFFHSFGFTVTLCLPLVLGPGVVYYPNPLDARGIGAIVRQNEVTVMLATATFLQIYLRAVAPEDFGSLKLIVTGAEKLPERLAAAFEERFGIRPFEGYGCTECAPAVAVNTWDYRAAGFYQVGSKHGKIGQPVPGMCVRIADAEDPWNGKTHPPGEPGMLLLRGPNIMLGYLNHPEKTAEVLRDGWYCTGDMAMLDEDGFLQITGRLNRFSKIGGEMVPHLKIEEQLQELAGVAEQAFVVIGVPDEKKGERLVVLHRLSEADLQRCLEKFAACELPNLWKPKADAFHHVENFPVLGTGKLDLRGVKELAATLAG
jgi:acyl-[acyl-carrier-protein]-phospholipid O-acyltransferase/long-chain-fatty-acid--[acyl-carrier-protein] ligase